MNLLKRIVKKMLRIIRKILSKIYHLPIRILNKIKREISNIKLRSYYTKQVKNACNIIKSYEGKEYIVLYNPTWLGVANSTKGLFEYIVPLEQVFGKNNIQQVASAIVDSNIEQVVFSQLVDGWTDVLKEIKRLKPETQIKVIWHANNSEVMSDYTWPLNKELLKLYDLKLVDAFAFVKKSMVEFYNKVGYKSLYLINNVKSNIVPVSQKKKEKNIKIGIYNASSREIKNIYTQLNSIKLIDNAIADIVPTYSGAIDFLKIIDLKYEHLEDYIPTEELLKRIQGNDINLYITFTECSPMFPLESFEMGVPCLVGNNNDYFQDSKLGDYVIVSREDDAEYIKDKILECLEHRDEIMDLYKNWKQNFDVQCKKNVQSFLEDN